MNNNSNGKIEKRTTTAPKEELEKRESHVFLMRYWKYVAILMVQLKVRVKSRVYPQG